MRAKDFLLTEHDGGIDNWVDRVHGENRPWDTIDSDIPKYNDSVVIKRGTDTYSSGEQTKTDFLNQKRIDQQVWANELDGHTVDKPDPLDYTVQYSDNDDDWYFDETKWERDQQDWHNHRTL